jgi:hypothetical protein
LVGKSFISRVNLAHFELSTCCEMGCHRHSTPYLRTMVRTL